MSDIRPIGDKIVIKVLEEASVTPGGIFLTESVREVSQRGLVIAVGDGRTLENGNKEEMEVKVGETILFTKYCGSDVKVDGVDYKVLSIRDLIGVIE